MSEAMRKSFRAVQFVQMQEVNGKDCYMYKVIAGSSKLNTKEMTELLDCSFDWLTKLGINYQDFERMI